MNRRIIATVFLCPLQEDIYSQKNIHQYHNIQNIDHNIQNIQRIFTKNRKFRASQRLITSKISNSILILSDARIIQTDQNIARDNNKFINLSEKYCKCLSCLRISLR